MMYSVESKRNVYLIISKTNMVDKNLKSTFVDDQVQIKRISIFT